MCWMRSLFILGIEFVVQIDEVVVQIVVQIIVVIVIIKVIVVELVIFLVVVPLLVVLEIVFVVIFQIVLEVFVFGVVVSCLLRQPRLRPPIVLVQEAPRGLQHGAHYRNLLVVRPKRARASPRVTTSYDRSR